MNNVAVNIHVLFLCVDVFSFPLFTYFYSLFLREKLNNGQFTSFKYKA